MEGQEEEGRSEGGRVRKEGLRLMRERQGKGGEEEQEEEGSS